MAVKRYKKSKKKLIGVLTCPECGHKQKMQIPEKICVHFYKCDNCGKTIRGKKRCVFCTYGDRDCPTKC